MQDPAAIAQALCQAPPLHARVEPILLPLSVRQNRVEDVFTDFLRWLGSGEHCGAEKPPGFTQSASGIAEFVMDAADRRPLRVVMPRDRAKRDLLERWMQAELVIEPSQTNKSSTAKRSVRPLHIVVGECFEPPDTSQPNYGKFVSELLSRSSQGLEMSLLSELAGFFGSAGGDHVARLLQDVLGPESGPPAVPQYERLSESDRQVWCVNHAIAFQNKVRSVLAYKELVSRRVLLEWLYCIITLYLSTYFLRMAAAAEACAASLEAAACGADPGWALDSLETDAYVPSIPYGRQDESHARLLKQFPAATSQIRLTRKFVEIADGREYAPSELSLVAERLADYARDGLVEKVFSLASRAFPTKGSTVQGAYKLTEEERARILQLTKAQASSYQIFTRYLNFEDMSRRSNNVLEWQFYSSLAKNREYGFARAGRSGDNLHYELSDSLAVALVHCHCVECRDEPTLKSFAADLELIGFVLGGEGRQLLEGQLVRLGLMESLADASDAKRLVPLYAIGRQRS
jgi:hypothetical protein